MIRCHTWVSYNGSMPVSKTGHCGSDPQARAINSPVVRMADTPECLSGDRGFESRRGHQYACVVELAYTSDLNSEAVRIEGSNPSAGTMRV